MQPTNASNKHPIPSAEEDWKIKLANKHMPMLNKYVLSSV